MARIHRVQPPPAYMQLLGDSNALGESQDCAVVAVSIACGVSYGEAHSALAAQGRKNRSGTRFEYTENVCRQFGFELVRWNYDMWRLVLGMYPPRVHAQYITTHQPRRFPNVWGTFKNQVLLFRTQSHILAVKDGVVQDWSINRSLRVRAIYAVRKIQ